MVFYLCSPNEVEAPKENRVQRQWTFLTFSKSTFHNLSSLLSQFYVWVWGSLCSKEDYRNFWRKKNILFLERNGMSSNDVTSVGVNPHFTTKFLFHCMCQKFRQTWIKDTNLSQLWEWIIKIEFFSSPRKDFETIFVKKTNLKYFLNN